ncbi:MAG TPA: alpha/beta hydrolase [Segetibacter sp.]
MNKVTQTIVAMVCVTFILFACSVKLTSITNKSPEQIKVAYDVIKNLKYGSDKEQIFDLYISKEAKKLGNKNFTIVFLHGGGYYLSDKSKEEKYIEPYLKKGMNVVNMNYRLKRGIPIATEDLTNLLNFLKANNSTYQLNLNKTILTGFSSGAHIASIVGLSANNPHYLNKLEDGIKISAIINFSGPVDGLDVVEKIFINNNVPLLKDIGIALFPLGKDYAPKDTITKYDPITYFDKKDPLFFLWHGGKDDQIPASTFVDFVALLGKNKNKNKVIFNPGGLHSPNATELNDAYNHIFIFLDR